jgi:hypothetical protein
VDTKYQKENFTIVSLDESFLFYDSLVRRVWIDKEKRPVVRITGSHKYSCLFGAIGIDGRQLFRQVGCYIQTDTFFDFKTIHTKFPKCYLFMDKASPHYRSRKVKEYLENNKDNLIQVYLPISSPEFMMFEKLWNIAK